MEMADAFAVFAYLVGHDMLKNLESDLSSSDAVRHPSGDD